MVSDSDSGPRRVLRACTRVDTSNGSDSASSHSHTVSGLKDVNDIPFTRKLLT